MIPDFKTPQEAIKWLHLPVRRKCMKCKGKKEQKNGNAFWCNKCIAIRDKKVLDLKASRAFYAKDPHLVPEAIRKLYF